MLVRQLARERSKGLVCLPADRLQRVVPGDPFFLSHATEAHTMILSPRLWTWGRISIFQTGARTRTRRSKSRTGTHRRGGHASRRRRSQ